MREKWLDTEAMRERVRMREAAVYEKRMKERGRDGDIKEWGWVEIKCA